MVVMLGERHVEFCTCNLNVKTWACQHQPHRETKPKNLNEADINIFQCEEKNDDEYTSQSAWL